MTNKIVLFLTVFSVLHCLSLFSLLVALQKHFKNLEALALDRDEPEELIDYTGNNIIVAASSCCYERNLVPTRMCRSVMYPEKCCILIYPKVRFGDDLF